MIPLVKHPPPDVLTANAAAWTATVLNKISLGETPTDSEKKRYGHPQIKATLLIETNGKCAYCESKLRHITYGDIEHVIPKSIVPSLWFDWNNLTIACDVCNTHKGNFVGDHTNFVDPYNTDPAQHVWFLGEVMWPRPGSAPGVVTEYILQLNRTDLVERRKERLRGLLHLLATIVQTQNPVAKIILQTDFLEELKDEKEFAALARAVHRAAQADGIVP